MTYIEGLQGKTIRSVSNEISETFVINPQIKPSENESKVELFVRIGVGEYYLHVYNPYNLVGIVSINDLIGRRIVKTEECEDSISFIFEENTRLTINLSDNAFIGPEALVLFGPDNLCVVWN